MATHVIHGDDFLVTQRTRKLIAASGNQSTEIFVPTDDPTRALASAQTIPFLDPSRLIRINGVLSEKAPRGQSRGRKRIEHNWLPFAHATPDFPQTTTVLWVDPDLNDKHPLLEHLESFAKMHTLPAPTGPELHKWIRESSEQRGLSLEPHAVAALAAAAPDDLWRLNTEIEKLSLYRVGPEAATRADVNLLVEPEHQQNIFTAIDETISGRPDHAARMIHHLVEQGQHPLHIMAMLHRQLRLIAIARESIDQGLTHAQAKANLAQRSDFVYRKITEQARQFDRTSIEHAFQSVISRDLDIKTSAMSAAAALNCLIADLARPPTPPPQGA